MHQRLKSRCIALGPEAHGSCTHKSDKCILFQESVMEQQWEWNSNNQYSMWMMHSSSFWLGWEAQLSKVELSEAIADTLLSGIN